MYARRHTKKRGTLIVACPALEAFELARITEQTTKTPRRMRKKHTTPFFTNECNMNIIIPIDIYRCMVLVILEVFEVSRAKNQASINAFTNMSVPPNRISPKVNTAWSNNAKIIDFYFCST